MRVHFLRHGLPIDNLGYLPTEFFDRLGAGAGDRLVARGKNPFHLKCLVEGKERHQRDGGGAIGIGDNALVAPHISSIDFGNHQRDGVVHAKGAGVIHDHASRPGRNGGELLRNAAASAEQGDVNSRE